MKKFFEKIWAFIKVLFSNPEQWIADNVLPSIELVEAIKRVVNNPLADILTAIIPGHWDDLLKQKFTEHLNTAIIVLSGIEHNNYEEFVKWLRSLTPATRAAVYSKLASKLAKYNASNDDVKNNSIDLMIQATYSKIKHNVNEDDLEDEQSGILTGAQMLAMNKIL